MKSIIIQTISVLMVVIGLLSGLPFPTQAAQPQTIVLKSLNGTAATPWAVNNLAPGDSGTETVVLSNTGSYSGSVSIWISNIRGTPGTPPPSTIPTAGSLYLKDYLLFQLSGNGLSSNIAMPATLNDFPQGDSTGPQSEAKQLMISRLDPGQSVDLTWQWSLPPATGNEVQGASLSFDVNYGLTEILPSTPPAPEESQYSGVSSSGVSSSGGTYTRVIQLSVPNGGSVSGITDTGIITDTLAASTPDQSFSLSIPQSTKLTLSNANRPIPVDLSQVGSTTPDQIVVTNPPLTTIPQLPDGWMAVSQAYDVNGVTNGFVTGIQMDKSATLIIKYNGDELPPIVDGLAVFYYNYQMNGWEQLNPPDGFIAEGPEMAAQVDHFSLFIVLARAGGGYPPANIIIQRLTVNPPRIQVGQISNIRVLVTNKGGTAGNYVIVLRVSGQVQNTQFVQLGPGESKEVDITLSPGLSGTYTVTVGAASANLIVEPLPATATALNYWWVWLILGISFLLFIIFGIAYLRPLLADTGRRTIGLEVPQASASSGISSQGVISGTLAAATPDSRFSLRIEKRTKIRIPEEDRSTLLLSQFGDILPSRIEVTIPAPEIIPTLPDGWVAVSLPLDIHAVTNDVIHGFELNKPARLIIRYDIKETLFNKDGPALFSFNPQVGWVKLAAPENFILQGLEIAAEVYRSSLFIVLAS